LEVEGTDDDGMGGEVDGSGIEEPFHNNSDRSPKISCRMGCANDCSDFRTLK